MKYIGNNKSKNLISFHNESPETVKGLYVIPQELNYWDPTTDTTTTSITTNKAYFIISCKVWSINGSDITYLWGTESSYADIAVPVVVPTVDGEGNIDKSSKFEWKQGTKYAYTFNFSNGAGYVPPTEGGSGNGGDPVLVPITISLTVDEFVEGDAFNIDTNLETE